LKKNENTFNWRTSAKGWWVGWYESGKRKTKALPGKALAEHYHPEWYEFCQASSWEWQVHT